MDLLNPGMTGKDGQRQESEISSWRAANCLLGSEVISA